MTVTSGTVTLAANSGVDIGDVDVTSLPALAAGTAEIGNVVISDTTNQASITSTGGSMEGLATALIDGNGDALTFDGLTEFSATPTLGTAACAQYDALHATPITLSTVVNGNGGTGHLLGGGLTSLHNTFAGQVAAVFFRTTPGAQTAQDAVSVADGDVIDYIGRMVFDFSETALGVTGAANAQRADLPIPFKCDASADDLFVLLQLWSSDTPTFAASDLTLRVQVQAD